MKNVFTQLRYDLDQYDEYCCLKPTTALIASLLFICRPYLMPLALYMSASSHSATDFGAIVYGAAPVTALVGAVPTLLLLYALRKRTPRGNRFDRWIWTHGRILMGSSLVVQTVPQVLVVFTDMTRDGGSSVNVPLQGLLVALNVVIGLYILLSRRVRDTFAAVPAITQESAIPATE